MDSQQEHDLLAPPSLDAPPVRERQSEAAGGL
jgi:hypothetical protein